MLSRECEHCGGSGKVYRGPRFLRGHKKLVRDILARPDTALLVACHPDDPDTILGWACTGPDVVFYVFVKRDVRRVGVASSLLAPYVESPREVVYTHRGNIEPPPHFIYDHHRNYFEFQETR